FDFRQYTAEAFGIEKGTRASEVVIRFAPRQARWIRERKWHPSARIQEEMGGGLVLRLRVAETSERRRWGMHVGPEAGGRAAAAGGGGGGARDGGCASRAASRTERMRR